MGRRKVVLQRDKTPTEKEMKQTLSALNSAKFELEEVNKIINQAEKEALEIRAGLDRGYKELKSVGKDLEDINKIRVELVNQESRDKKLAKEAEGLRLEAEKKLASVRKDLDESKKRHDQVLADDIKKHEQIKNNIKADIEVSMKEVNGLKFLQENLVRKLEDLNLKASSKEREIEKLELDREKASKDYLEVCDKKKTMEASVALFADKVKKKRVAFEEADKDLKGKEKEVESIERKLMELKDEVLRQKNALLSIVVREKKFYKTKEIIEQLLKDVGLDIKI